MMPLVLDDDLIYPEFPYLFSVKTPGGFADIAVDETQWDIATSFEVKDFGSPAARMFLKLHFERYGIDLQGKAIDLDDPLLSPEAIFNTLSRKDQEKCYITSFELLNGHQPDALPDSFIIPETGDNAEERSPAAPFFESADFEPWIGFDLDGTLAKRVSDEDTAAGKIGDPIWPIVDLLRGHIYDGDTVKIFTARAADEMQIPHVEGWLADLGLKGIEVTNVKDPGMVKLYDDRVSKVVTDQGIVLESSAGLIDIDGDQFGTDRRTIINKVRIFAKRFFGKPVLNIDSRFKIHINRNGIGKVCGSPDIRDILAITKLDELLKYAHYEGPEAQHGNKGRPNIQTFHRFSLRVRYSGKLETIILLVREDNSGHFHYNQHFVGTKKGVSEREAVSAEKRLTGPADDTPFKNRIKPITEAVNLIPGGLVLESAVSFKQKKFTLADRYQFQGMPISIENKAGQVRRGVDPDGHKWETKMHFDYGYIRRTEGEDGDGIDVYVGKDRNAQHVYIVKQHKIEAVKAWDGEYCPDCQEHIHDCGCKEYYDEDKVFIGFSSKKAAIEAYNKQYDSPLFLGPVSTMTVESFRDLVTGEKEKVQIPLQLVAENSADSAVFESAGDWRKTIRKAKFFCHVSDATREALDLQDIQPTSVAETKALGQFFKRLTMKKHEYKLPMVYSDGRKTTETVTGWRHGDIFATHQIFRHSFKDDKDIGSWVVTHLQTGGKVREYPTKIQAAEFMWRASQLGKDIWSFDTMEQMPKELNGKMMSIIKAMSAGMIPFELEGKLRIRD